MLELESGSLSTRLMIANDVDSGLEVLAPAI